MNPAPKPSKRYRLFERRRGFPRLIMEIPAKVTGHDGSTIDVKLQDLSPGGAQIRYPVAEGLNLFPGSDDENRNNSKKLKCRLQFRLETGGDEHKIDISARSVYLRPLDKKTLASGLVFDQADHAERELIQDYLHHQLEASFAEMEREDHPELTSKPLERLISSSNGTIHRQTEVEKDNDKDKDSETTDHMAGHLERMGETGTSRSDMEYLKQELVRMQSSLKVIQETTRHIDEKLALLEQKIMRGH